MKKQLPLSARILVTTAIVVIAVIVVAATYWDYVVNPWTRNGQVHAQVIQITPRVTGPVVQLPIVDNQFVKAGDLLFEIDPRTFQADVDHAYAELRRTRARVQSYVARVESETARVSRTTAAVRAAEQKIDGKKARLEDYRRELKRYSELVKTGAASQERVDQAIADVTDTEAVVITAEAELLDKMAAMLEARADLDEAIAIRGSKGEANASISSAVATLTRKELDLEFTRVVAPVDGFITNMNMRLGDHVTANQAALALVDVNSYWIYGYFKESYTGRMRPGDKAIVTLMSYPDQPVEGVVESIGWGVYQEDGSTGEELLPEINATFEWIRLAQRIPVRIILGELPEGVELRVGTTASVMVKTGTAGKKTAGEKDDDALVAVPKLLQ